MIVFILAILGIFCVGWGIGGVIGGTSIAGSLWQAKENSVAAKQVFAGWILAMVAGAIVFYISFLIFQSLMDLIMPSHYWWGWSVVPEVLAYCLAGATIGLQGAYLMFPKDEHTERDISEN